MSYCQGASETAWGDITEFAKFLCRTTDRCRINHLLAPRRAESSVQIDLLQQGYQIDLQQGYQGSSL